MNRQGLTVAIIVMSLVSGTALASKLYKYQDENGRWHFTDQEPMVEAEVEMTRIEVFEPKKMLTVMNQGTRRQPKLYAVNHSYGPLMIELQVIGQNIRVHPSRQVRQVVPPNKSVLVATIGPENLQYNFQYRYAADYTLGDPSATPDEAVSYGLPVDENSGFAISQGWDGEFSHNGPQNRHAIDVGMPVGSPIYAARDGVVMTIEQDFFRSGANSNLMHKANLVRILHDDGTMAVYAHLQRDGIKVRQGERVSKGQHIASSGNTGFSTGPHLHFVVQQNVQGRLESIPYRLENSLAQSIAPQAGTVLQ